MPASIVKRVNRCRAHYAKNLDCQHGMISALETDIGLGKYPSSEVDRAVLSGHIIRGNHQTAYVRLTA